ncbi:SDR family oxidoreductase [Streptomyces sp. NBC_00669]|uniref:SDR family oxidoreductase n=1 Tax=Streptomyces sp. NBC_00669 TaxID=2976011 RepID=UPI002E3487BE|nr:SDR family oxidoreductase [Streptomyces sp. NBC_00669]
MPTPGRGRRKIGGDSPVARQPDYAAPAPPLSEWPPLRLDVADRGAVTAAAGRAAGTFGHLDIVVNNAGYGLFGMVEETTEEQARAQLDTDLLGPLRVTQAARCRSCAPGAAGISSRCPASAASPPSPPSACTTPPSGRSKE